MSKNERHTLTELLVRYELEPTLQDIYVEGSFDKDVLTRAYRGAGDFSKIFYEIDCVDIPVSTLESLGLTDGNKQRVIALAKAMAHLSEKSAYRCLVDKDLDEWLGTMEQVPRLMWTPFCTLELHFFHDDILQDILLTTAKAKIEDWLVFRLSLVSILRDLYLMRLADRELGWCMKWPPHDKCLQVQGSSIAFQKDEYIKRLLLRNGRGGSKDYFDSSLTDWHSKLAGDERNFIRGHDLMDTAAWCVHRFRGIRAFTTTEALERLLVLMAPRVLSLLFLDD